MDDVVLPGEQLPVQVLRWNTTITAILPTDAGAIRRPGRPLHYLQVRSDAGQSQLRPAARDVDGVE
jgi:hypothetical protein